MFVFEEFKQLSVGEVVPAREGLRRDNKYGERSLHRVGEVVVPAKEGFFFWFMRNCNIRVQPVEPG